MNLVICVLFNCAFTFFVYLMMANKVNKAKEREAYFDKYQMRLTAFSTLVDEFTTEVAKKEGLTIKAIDIKPSFKGVEDVLVANVAILDRQNSTNRSILFTIYEDCPILVNKILSYDFVKERVDGWKHYKAIGKYSFEDWFSKHFGTREVNTLKGIGFKSYVFEVWDEYYPIGKEATKKIEKEYLEACAYLDKTIISKTISSIKRKSTNLIKLAEDIDDIDISVSIAEFDENTNAFVEFVTDEVEKDLNNANNKSLAYLESINVIRKNLKTFLSLKETGKLTKEDETILQNEVEKEISKWNNLIKEGA